MRNDYPDSRNFIKLAARIFSENAKLLEEKEFYAGNTFTKKELGRLRPVEIESRLANELGSFNSNTNVAPGEGNEIDFMVVFYGYKGSVDSYEVTPLGSQGTGE